MNILIVCDFIDWEGSHLRERYRSTSEGHRAAGTYTLQSRVSYGDGYPFYPADIKVRTV